MGPLELGDDPALPCQGGGQGVQPLPVKAPGLALAIPPSGGEAGGFDREGEVLPGHKPADLLLPVHNEGQGGSLDPPGRELGVVLAGEGPGHVEPD